MAGRGLASLDQPCEHRRIVLLAGMCHMYLMSRLLTVVAVFVVVGVSAAIGNAVGMPVGQSASLGLLVTGVTILSLHLVFGDGAASSPFRVAAFVMLLFAALGTIVAGKEMWPGANGFLLFAGAIVVEVLAFLLLTSLVTAVTQRVVRSGLANERRDLANSRGWQYEPSDADLPSVFNGVEHFGVHVPGKLLAYGPRPVPGEARAHDIVHGEAGGVEFVAFDFFTPRRLRLPEVTTAWAVQLPQALPLFTSAEVFRDVSGARVTSVFADVGGQGGNDSVTTKNPDYARAVMTDDVVRLTREHLGSWWVDGRLLATTARLGHGAPPDVLVRNIEAIIWLATVLSSPQIARFATAQPDARTRAN
jgi:hypothetical protein